MIGCIELVSIDLMIDFTKLVAHFIELVEIKWLCMGEMVISSFVLFEITRGSFPTLIILFHEQKVLYIQYQLIDHTSGGQTHPWVVPLGMSHLDFPRLIKL